LLYERRKGELWTVLAPFHLQRHMKHYSYKTFGTCSKAIEISVDDDGKVVEAQFVGGCNGNLKGVCALIRGRKASDVRATLSGILCKDKPTSCPDQLARALAEMGY